MDIRACTPEKLAVMLACGLHARSGARKKEAALQLGHEQLGRPVLERAFDSGGEAGAIMRALDWSRTPSCSCRHAPAKKRRSRG
jgi:hypothetical protein